MRTLPGKYLSDIPVSKDTYEVDLAVLDRYQAFSAELLRLALLGLAGYGFLITKIALVTIDSAGTLGFLNSLLAGKHFLAVGVISLAFAAMCALGHRYFSTDSIAHHIRRLRLHLRCETLDAGDQKSELMAVAQHESESLRKDLNRCRWLLVGSSSFLVLGTVCVALSFALTLFPSSPS